MIKKALSLVLAAGLLAGFAACSQTDGSSGLVPSSSPALSDTSADSSQAIPEPLPTVYPGVLTGLPVPEDEVPDTRIAAVMVNNHPTARTLAGLSEADILVEMITEGGITRFLAMYEDYKNMPEVGPVRSSRDGFLQLAMPFQPLYISDGGSQPNAWFVYAFEQHERLLEPRHGVVQRSTSRAAASLASSENTFYTSGALLEAAVLEHGVDDARHYNSTFFHFLPFGAPARTPQGGSADTVKVIHSDKYITTFDYDSATHRYKMAQYNSFTEADRVPAIDVDNGQQLAFDNLLVLFAEMPEYEGLNPSGATDVREVQLGFGGAGYYFSAGGWQRLRWAKQSPQHVLQLLDAEDGITPVEINPGTSYLAVVDVEQATRFAFGPHGGERSLSQQAQQPT